MAVSDRFNKAKAIEHYEKFLSLWKDADPGIAEVDDARGKQAEKYYLKRTHLSIYPNTLRQIIVYMLLKRKITAILAWECACP